MNIKEKVLLIEDERTIRRFMQAILTANGYDVLMAGTGAMADTMISSHCPDIIILDLGLPRQAVPATRHVSSCRSAPSWM